MKTATTKTTTTTTTTAAATTTTTTTTTHHLGSSRTHMYYYRFQNVLLWIHSYMPVSLKRSVQITIVLDTQLHACLSQKIRSDYHCSGYTVTCLSLSKDPFRLPLLWIHSYMPVSLKGSVQITIALDTQLHACLSQRIRSDYHCSGYTVTCLSLSKDPFRLPLLSRMRGYTSAVRPLPDSPVSSSRFA